jgi:hypothetical protein
LARHRLNGIAVAAYDEGMDVEPVAQQPPAREPFRPTDSPWFWATAFSLMALVGIGLIAPKFAVRQRQVEGRFLGRQQAAEERARRAAGLPPIDLAAEARDREVAAPARIVPLWTLATAAGLATIGSGIMLRREYLSHEYLARR